eukprot:COSAG01_NODE_15206_length_1361_cov_5.092710_1_plen_146_part_00
MGAVAALLYASVPSSREDDDGGGGADDGRVTHPPDAAAAIAPPDDRSAAAAARRRRRPRVAAMVLDSPFVSLQALAHELAAGYRDEHPLCCGGRCCRLPCLGPLVRIALRLIDTQVTLKGGFSIGINTPRRSPPAPSARRRAPRC